MGVSIKEGVAAYKEKTKKLRKEQKRRKQHNDKFYPEKPKNDADSAKGKKYGGPLPDWS